MVLIKYIPFITLLAAVMASPVQKRTYKGEVTYYHPEVDLGSCGKFNVGDAMIVAINAP
ncbi:hypothetical protein Unana1_02196 [Umbelopsis nana]